MNVKTYTFTAAGSTNYYQWMPRIIIKSPGRRVVCIPTEASYRRFVRLANSGQYNVAIAEEESIAWTLSRYAAPQASSELTWEQEQDIAAYHQWKAEDDWKRHDRQDHDAAADYYDGLLTGR